MYIVITSATTKETMLLKKKLNAISKINHEIVFHFSGVGLMLSTFSIARLFSHRKPDIAIQCGIAGSYNRSLQLGNIVLVRSEVLGTLGVEENGEWKDVFDNGFIDKNEYPFDNKKLINKYLPKLNIDLPHVNGVTVDEITTRNERMIMLKKKYAANIETMEGAAFHYNCLQFNVPFFQIRGISNLVGERDKSKWEIMQSVERTNEYLYDFIVGL